MAGSNIELLNAFPKRSIRAILFDFDGTVSLIRSGWQQVMTAHMVEVLSQLGSGETAEALQSLVEEFIAQLTGKQTIYQMIRLAEEVKKRGGSPLDPVVYKHQYHRRLWDVIGERIELLRHPDIDYTQWLVPGTLPLLQALRARGIPLYLASGTDEEYVREEVRLLRLSSYFEDRVWGALDEYRRFSKRMLIERLFREEGLEGPDFLAFGDGYVEIENTKEFGGIAVGVASNEDTRQGVNQWKRTRLITAGADIVIPDFRDHEELLQMLF